MFNAANRPAGPARAPKAPVEPPKDLLETSKVSPDTPLYHGTTHFFKDGEVVRPTDAVNARFKNAPLRSLYGANVPPKVRTTDYVYSTSDLGIAKNYARDAARAKNHRFAPVYELEPQGDVHSLHKLLSAQDPKGRRYPEELLKFHKDSYISEKAMIPKTISTWVENREGTKIPKEFDALTRAYSAMTGAPEPTYKSKADHISEQFANIELPIITRKQD
jgi:hypothetical protein